MALQWHQFLAELLREAYSDRLIIQEEVPLGELPLEADLLLIRRDPSVPLPYPLEFLGQRTLVEFKSPDDSADQAALQQLEIYGLLYVRRERLERRDLTLWLLASQFTANVSQPGGAELVNLTEVGPGVRRGTLDKFPTLLVDLRHVPFSPATMPLHMVARGPQEHALVEYLVEHHRQFAKAIELLPRLHAAALLEVLHMRTQMPEEIDQEIIKTLVKLLGPEQAAENAADHLSAEHLLKILVRRHGKQGIRQILDQLESGSSGAE